MPFRHELVSRALDGCGWMNRRVLSRFGLRGSRLVPGAEFERVLAWLSPLDAGHQLIRVGDHGDGGYLIPDDLEGIVACLSPGTDDRISFEKEFLDRGIPCYLADASLAESPLAGNPLISFSPSFIGAVTGGRFLSLSDWVSVVSVPAEGDLVMQMDVEGWEYQSLLCCPDSLLERCRVLVVEFHDFHRCLELYRFRDVLSPLMARLSRVFDPVHVHANNAGFLFDYAGLKCPSAFELTLHRRDRRLKPICSVVDELPRALDSPNLVDRPDIAYFAAGWPVHAEWA